MTLERQLRLTSLVDLKTANRLRSLYKGATELQAIADKYRHVGSNDALVNAGRAWAEFGEAAAQALGMAEKDEDNE